jgi:hypothetical protein
MQAVQLLPAGHPSFGTKRALFLFVIGQERNLLSVEATNEWAVLSLERLLSVDGKVSDVCEVLQVIRDYRTVGTRSEAVVEVPYPDFMTDIVDPNRMASDVCAMEAFKNALSPEENQRVQLKYQSAPVEDVWEGFDTPALPPAESAPETPKPADNGQADRLTSALVNLGFKKAEVRQVVAAIGDRVLTDDMHSLIREGLGQLAA